MGLEKLLTIQVVYSRRARRAYAKAHGWFGMKMVCQAGTLAGNTFAARVVDAEIQAQCERPDFLDSIDDRSGELVGAEAALVVPRMVPGDVLAMPIADVAMVNGATESQITITLNDDKGYPIVVDASTQVETPVSLQKVYASNAEDAHYRNRQMLVSTKMAACTAGQRHKYSNAADDVLSYDDILTAKKELTNAKAPLANRFMAIPASQEAELLKIDKFISTDKMGKAVIPDGVIGKVAGFWVRVYPDGAIAKTHIADGTAGTSGDEVETCYFYHKFAVAFARHLYNMVGPQLSAGADKSLWNLHCKQGAAIQVDTFAVTYRKNA
jgi:hypothetical protein